MHANSRFSPLALPLALLGLAGCPDPAAEFDDFETRWRAANPDAGGGVVDSGPCPAPDPSALGGRYIFALSAVIERTKPILFLADVSGGPEGLTFALQPLSAADRRTPVGPPTTVGPFPLSPDGAFHAELPPLVVTGEANPITGSQIAAQLVVLDARFCDISGFYCGSVSGNLIEPIPLDLATSTFAMERITGGTPPAEPYLSCARDRAVPL
jgi:hypothetical protein